MKVTVSGPSLAPRDYEFDSYVTVEEILQMVKDEMPYPIYLCKLDNNYRWLKHEVVHDAQIEFLDIRNTACWSVYQNSLSLVYMKAVHDVLGEDAIVTVQNSFNKGLYTLINKEFDYRSVVKIEDRMREIVNANLPIEKQYLKKDEAIALAKELKQEETVKLLKSIPNVRSVEIFSLVKEMQIFYGLLVPSTGYLQLFELIPYKDGILLRYPHPNDPNTIPEWEDQALLYEAFQEAKQWGKLLEISYVDDVNEIVKANKVRDMFMLQEALHEKRISNIADRICRTHKRVVLICGPSSSGKTTFAKRLIVQLRVNGYKTMYMGTDDYFKESHEAPYDENGERDYESIRAIDTKLFVNNLKGLLAGEMVDLPRYEFATQSKVFGERFTQISEDTIIVIEGIHALNHLLTEGIDDNWKYKIYISPFTPLSVDHHNRIMTTDCRLLRRIVRDHQFRNWSCKQTIDTWPKVRAGEDNNIFPFHSEADTFFNSNCIYELNVLKKYAEPMLKEIKRSEPEYAEAQRLLSFLRFFQTIEDTSDIVNNSIIREFIGGSIMV